ncbi:MAG: HD-GYP domain-containing protein [Deferrisomatales bacterium]
MPPIVHPHLFALLALEFDTPAHDLQAAAAAGGAEALRLGERLGQAGFDGLELTLAEPLVDGRDGAVLLAERVHLTHRYLGLLLARQMRDQGAVIGPISVVASAGALRHYQGKARRHFETLVQGVRESTQGGTRLIHDAIRTAADLKNIEQLFEQIVDRLLDGGEGLTLLLAATAAPSSRGVLGHSIDVSFVTMAVRARYGDLEPGDRARDEVTDLGLAALLGDVSLAMEPDADPGGHPERSARAADALGASSRVQDLIRAHHDVRTPQGLPALGPVSSLPTAQRVLVTVTVFHEMIRREGAGTSFETMKALSHLADAGFADTRAVRVICRMYLPRLKSYIMEQAARIGDRCPRPGARPILWPVTGDKVPTVFLCRDQTCGNRTDQVSRIAHPVPFQVDGAAVTTIEQGEYFTCPPLTRDLRRLYEVVQAHIKQDAGGKG